MRKHIAVLGVIILVFLCAPGALADAEWMDTITSNGTRYVGYVENGDLNGFGTSNYTNGAQYYGMHANGSRNGFGIFVYADDQEDNSSYLLIGNYVDGPIVGHGIAQDRNGYRYDGPFSGDGRAAKVGYTIDEYGFVSDVYLGEGNGYTGEVLPGTMTPHGFGIMIAGDGALYVGQFVSGVKEGYGISCTYEKVVTSGLWANGVLVDPGAQWE